MPGVPRRELGALKKLSGGSFQLLMVGAGEGGGTEGDEFRVRGGGARGGVWYEGTVGAVAIADGCPG